MRRQATIQVRLFWCFGIVLLAAFGNSAYALFTMRSMRAQLASEVSGNGALLDGARQVTISIANMRSSMRGITLFSMTHNAKGLAAARVMIDKSNQEAGKAVDEMEARNLTAEERSTVEGIRSRMTQWKDKLPTFAELVSSAGPVQADAFVVKEISPLMDWLQTGAAGLGARSRDRQQRGYQSLEASMSRTELLNWGLLLVLIATAAATWLVVARMVGSLKEVAEAFKSGAEEVMSAARQVSTASQGLAQQSSEQAASLEETSASAEEISSMARRNSENSQTSATVAGEAGRQFLELNNTLNEMVSGMQGIHESSGNISKIIKVIDQIAFQTNILALNAAVEAARAGEARMGFAVVADEVRNLSQRSAQAAKDTASLIEESISRSANAKLKVDQVADSVRAIAVGAAKVVKLSDEANVGSQEQLQGIEEIGKAISQMEQTTQATAAHAEQSAAASEQLIAQSEALNGIAVRMSGMFAVR
jgi:methyl-accepting chemotaxis protein/methyl-accepting chemotaxis protein-1 (serine sensor receptor)